MNKKFMNHPNNIVEDMISGFIKANDSVLEKVDGADVVISKFKKKNKVGVVIGNGSGHEPACIGFVGENMLDANAYGGLFAAPGPQAILSAIEAVDSGAGVCLLISNHAGDVINSRMAANMAKSKGINVRSVILYDDIASASKDEDPLERRGAAGTLFAYKLVGTYANGDVDLDQVCDYAEYIRDNIRSLSVSASSGTNPITNQPFFQLAENEYEIGMGVHGETMNHKVEICYSEKLAKLMVDQLLDDKEFDKNKSISVLVNGMGKTTWMELYTFYNDVAQVLDEYGYQIVRPIVGNYITTQDTAGISLALCELDDFDQTMLSAPTNAVAFKGI